MSNNADINSLPPGLFRLAGRIVPPTSEAAELKSLIVLGFARSGKTVLAHKFSDELGFATFSLDKVRHSTYSHPTTRRAYLDLLLRLYPTGLVIEGDNLIGENRSSAQIYRPVEFQKTLKFLSERAVVVCVGNSEATIAEKAEAILSYRKDYDCWTLKAHYSGSQVRNLADRSIRYSRQLREVADRDNLAYFEIRPKYFESDIASSASQIKKLLTTGL